MNDSQAAATDVVGTETTVREIGGTGAWSVTT